MWKSRRDDIIIDGKVYVLVDVPHLIKNKIKTFRRFETFGRFIIENKDAKQSINPVGM